MNDYTNGESLMDGPLPFLLDAKRALVLLVLDSPIWKLFATCVYTLFGHPDGATLAMGVLMVADTLTGIWKATKRRTWSKAKLRHMFGKWVTYLFLYLMAHQAGQASGYLGWLKEATVIFIIMTEYNSVAENLRCMGYKVPSLKAIEEMFRKVKGGSLPKGDDRSEEE